MICRGCCIFGGRSGEWLLDLYLGEESSFEEWVFGVMEFEVIAEIVDDSFG